MEVATEAGTEGIGVSVQDLAAYFYAYKGLVVLNIPERLQRLFNIITDLFGRIGLRNNLQKTVGIKCHPCHTSGSISVVLYKIQVTGIGPNYWDMQRLQVHCLECGVEFAAGLLLIHRQIKHIQVSSASDRKQRKLTEDRCSTSFWKMSSCNSGT